MKKILLALALSSFFGVSAFAQEVEGPKGGDEKEMSQAEMLAELHRLMAKASREMADSEKELAKASLPANKADVLAERVKALREQMQKGELKEIPDGLRQYLKDNPEKAAELTGKSTEEIKKISGNQDELDKLVKKSPDLLKKLAESDDTFDKILENQYAAERHLEETLKKQQETIKAASKDADDAINMAHQVQSQGQGKGGEPKNNDQKTKDPKEGQNDPKNGGKQPTKGAKEGYNPNPGDKPEDKTEEFTNNTNPEGAHIEKKGKDMGDGTSTTDTGEPKKYAGFWEKFGREIAKRTKKEAPKDGSKDAPKDAPKDEPKSGNGG